MCPYCEKRPKIWEGSDPRCAFPTEDSEFSTNWNCAALSYLRAYCYEFYAPIFESDQWQCIITLRGMPESLENDPIGLWITWYKSRGAVDMVLLMYSKGLPKKPNWKEMATILDYLREKHGNPQFKY